MLAASLQAGVVLTRPAGKNEALAARLQAAGCTTLLLPALRIHPLAGNKPPPMPGDYDFIIFVSSNAVHHYLDALGRYGQDAPWPSGTRVATVGAGSAALLYESGLIPAANILHPDPLASSQDSEGLWPILRAYAGPQSKVLIVRGQNGREWLAQKLSEAGMRVDCLPIYEREPAQWTATDGKRLEALLRGDTGPCVFLLTSGEGVAAVHANLSQLGLDHLWVNARFVVIHERVASRLQSFFSATSKVGAPMVKICQPSDDAIFQAIVWAASS